VIHLTSARAVRAKRACERYMETRPTECPLDRIVARALEALAVVQGRDLTDAEVARIVAQAIAVFDAERETERVKTERAAKLEAERLRYLARVRRDLLTYGEPFGPRDPHADPTLRGAKTGSR
jgi:hypothetical protein